MMFGAMLAASNPKELLPDMRELSAGPRRISIIGFESVMKYGELLSFSCPFHVAVLDAEFVETGGIAFLVTMILRLCRQEMPFSASTCVTAPSFYYNSAMFVSTSGILLRWTSNFQQQLHVGSYGEGESRSAGADRVHGERWRSARMPCIRWLGKPSSCSPALSAIKLCPARRKRVISFPEPMQTRRPS